MADDREPLLPLPSNSNMDEGKGKGKRKSTGEDAGATVLATGLNMLNELEGAGLLGNYLLDYYIDYPIPTFKATVTPALHYITPYTFSIHVSCIFIFIF